MFDGHQAVVGIRENGNGMPGVVAGQQFVEFGAATGGTRWWWGCALPCERPGKSGPYGGLAGRC
jgi:hypothetical protein